MPAKGLTKTACVHGHEYAESGVYHAERTFRGKKYQVQICKTCQLKRNKKYQSEIKRKAELLDTMMTLLAVKGEDWVREQVGSGVKS